MRSNSKHTAEELEYYIHIYLDDGISHRKMTEKFGLLVSKAPCRDKVLRYQPHDLKGI